MLCCLPVSPPRKTDIEMVPDLEDVSAIERTRTGDAFDVLVKPGQYLLDLVNFPPPALRSGVRDDRAPVCHDRRVFYEDRIGVPLVGAQHGHLQTAPLERADVVVVLLAGLLVIRPPQVRGCYPGVDRPRDGPDDGFAKHPRTLPRGIALGARVAQELLTSRISPSTTAAPCPRRSCASRPPTSSGSSPSASPRYTSAPSGEATTPLSRTTPSSAIPRAPTGTRQPPSRARSMARSARIAFSVGPWFRVSRIRPRSGWSSRVAAVRAPCPTAGSMRSGGITACGASAPKPSRSSPARASTIASASPARILRTLVSTLPRISTTRRSGRRWRSWARRLRLEVATTAPCGSLYTS